MKGGGIEGNERLTSAAGAVLLVLLAVESATLISLRALQLSDTDTEAVLNATTFAGELITGTDSVRVVS